MAPYVDLIGDATRRCMLALLAGAVAPDVLRGARRRLAAFPGRPQRTVGRAA